VRNYQIYLCVFLLLGTGLTISAQKSLPVDSNRYSIELPAYWKTGNKVWRILNDKLPLICPEVKNKDLCGEQCNPALKFTLHTSPVSVIDYNYHPSSVVSTSNTQGDNYEFVTHYKFKSWLELRNAKGELLVQLILVDENEDWTCSHMAIMPSSIQQASSMPKLVRQRSGNTTVLVFDDRALNSGTIATPVSDQTNPDSYIQKHRKDLMPTERAIFDIIDGKFRALSADSSMAARK
jgi:hypothetical protein